MRGTSLKCACWLWILLIGVAVSEDGVTMRKSAERETDEKTIPKLSGVVPDVSVCEQDDALGSPMCPNLILLGAQKCGTTSFHQWLAREFKGDIVMPSNPEGGKGSKEVHFFDKHWKEGVDYYQSYFRPREAKHETVMDATPGYFRYHSVPARVYQALGKTDVRFLLIVRDPVKRAYAWYNHIMYSPGLRMGYGNCFRSFKWSFELMGNIVGKKVAECVDEFPEEDRFRNCALDNQRWRDMEIYVEETDTTAHFIGAASQLFSDGLYAYILRLWFQYFDPSQFCIMYMEDMLTSLHTEVEWFRPCFKAAGFNPRIPRNAYLPRANMGKCKNCQQLSEERFAKLARYLNSILYNKANAALEEIMAEHYGRTDSETIRNWSAAYE